MTVLPSAHRISTNIDEDFVSADGFTDFLCPLQQRGFGHGLGQLGDFDFNDRHGEFLNEKWVNNALERYSFGQYETFESAKRTVDQSFLLLLVQMRITHRR